MELDDVGPKHSLSPPQFSHIDDKTSPRRVLYASTFVTECVVIFSILFIAMDQSTAWAIIIATYVFAPVAGIGVIVCDCKSPSLSSAANFLAWFIGLTCLTVLNLTLATMNLREDFLVNLPLFIIGMFGYLTSYTFQCSKKYEVDFTTSVIISCTFSIILVVMIWVRTVTQSMNIIHFIFALSTTILMICNAILTPDLSRQGVKQSSQNIATSNNDNEANKPEVLHRGNKLT